MAVVTVSIDTWLAQLVGIIRDGLPYDGIGYAIVAKASYLSIKHLGLGALLSERGKQPLVYLLSFAPWWRLLMVLHFFLFGSGLWQVYSVRFWQTFGFLFLTLWLGRRHGDKGFALFMAAAGIMLPTISPNMVAVLARAISGSSSNNVYNTVYAADLRPDMLYSVLLVTALVLLVESARNPRPLVMAIDGFIFGAAVLVKSSTLTLAVATWMLALGYLGIWQLRDRRHLAQLYSFAGGAFFLTILPWEFAGGFHAAIYYLKNSTLGDSWVFQYGFLHQSVMQNLEYYWDWFRNHMGLATGLPLMVFGILHLLRPRLLTGTSSWPQLAAYTSFAIFLYAIPTILTVKNYFLGLPAYLIAWVLLIILTAGIWRRIRMALSVPVSVPANMSLILLCCTFVFTVRVAEASVPAEDRHNLTLVQDIAHDVRRMLTNDDKYVTYTSADFPAIIQFFILDDEGNGPAFEPSVDWGYLFVHDPGAKEHFVSATLKRARAILMFKDNIQDASRVIYIPRGFVAVLQLIRDYLADPANRVCPYKQYSFRRLQGYDVNGGVTAVLYVPCDAATLRTGR